MSAQSINGIMLYHRPRSSSCPKGAWSSRHYHTCWCRGGWTVFETGVGEVACFANVTDAKGHIADLEIERAAAAQAMP